MRRGRQPFLPGPVRSRQQWLIMEKWAKPEMPDRVLGRREPLQTVGDAPVGSSLDAIQEPTLKAQGSNLSVEPS